MILDQIQADRESPIVTEHQESSPATSALNLTALRARQEAEEGSVEKENGDKKKKKKDTVAEATATCPLCHLTYPNEKLIGCDHCEKWFHWQCVDVTEEPTDDEWYCPECTKKRKKAIKRASTSLSTVESSDTPRLPLKLKLNLSALRARQEAEEGSVEKENGDKKKKKKDTVAEATAMCPLCHLTYPNEKLIGCDHCEKWFHWQCVNVTEDPTDDEWYCPECTKKGHAQKNAIAEQQMILDQIQADRESPIVTEHQESSPANPDSQQGNHRQANAMPSKSSKIRYPSFVHIPKESSTVRRSSEANASSSRKKHRISCSDHRMKTYKRTPYDRCSSNSKKTPTTVIARPTPPSQRSLQATPPSRRSLMRSGDNSLRKKLEALNDAQVMSTFQMMNLPTSSRRLDESEELSRIPLPPPLLPSMAATSNLDSQESTNDSMQVASRDLSDLRMMTDQLENLEDIVTSQKWMLKILENRIFALNKLHNFKPNA